MRPFRSHCKSLLKAIAESHEALANKAEYNVAVDKTAELLNRSFGRPPFASSAFWAAVRCSSFKIVLVVRPPSVRSSVAEDLNG